MTTLNGDELYQLVDALNGDLAQRTQAHQRLVELGSIAVEFLLESLSAERHKKLWVIVQVLGDIGDRRCIPVLISALRSDNALMSSAAVRSLIQYRDQADVVPYLLDVLPAASIMTQQTIVVSLQQFADTRAVVPLSDLLNDTESPALRCAIIQTLGKLGDKSTVPTIRAFQDDPDHHVREWAAVSLRQLEDSAAP